MPSVLCGRRSRSIPSRPAGGWGDPEILEPEDEAAAYFADGCRGSRHRRGRPSLVLKGSTARVDRAILTSKWPLAREGLPLRCENRVPLFFNCAEQCENGGQAQ